MNNPRGYTDRVTVEREVLTSRIPAHQVSPTINRPAGIMENFVNPAAQEIDALANRLREISGEG